MAYRWGVPNDSYTPVLRVDTANDVATLKAFGTGNWRRPSGGVVNDEDWDGQPRTAVNRKPFEVGYFAEPVKKPTVGPFYDKDGKPFRVPRIENTGKDEVIGRRPYRTRDE